MFFPVIVGLMALAAAWWLVRPLIASRGENTVAPIDARASYEASLALLSTDEAAGLISASDAARERAALARTLLNADPAQIGATPDDGQKALTRGIAFAILALAPLMGGAFYLLAGGALPLAIRAPEPRSPEIVQLEQLVRQLSERVTRQPDDAEGYRLLGVGLASLGRSTEAAEAYRTAIQLGSRSGETLAALGEALTIAQRGVSREALEAFNAALNADPDEPTALLFRGQAMMETGNLAAARTDWARLLANAPKDAPWREGLARQIAAIDQELAKSPDKGPASDPAMGAAISSLDPQARQAAIQSMVDGLAARLESQPDDVEGWKKLIRSYTVLGQSDKADAAKAKAEAVFKDRPDALKALED